MSAAAWVLAAVAVAAGAAAAAGWLAWWRVKRDYRNDAVTLVKIIAFLRNCMPPGWNHQLLHAFDEGLAAGALAGRDPALRGLGYRWFKIREAAGTVVWRVLRAVMPRIATAAMRERAWQAGFALALGGRSGHFLLSHLDSYTDGNEAGWECRPGSDPLPGPCRPFLVLA